MFLADLYYVDDSSFGRYTVCEGIEFYLKSKTILSEDGFELRKWVKNDKSLQDIFDSNVL